MRISHISYGEPETVGYYGTRSQDAVKSVEKNTDQMHERRENCLRVYSSCKKLKPDCLDFFLGRMDFSIYSGKSGGKNIDYSHTKKCRASQSCAHFLFSFCAFDIFSKVADTKCCRHEHEHPKG